MASGDVWRGMGIGRPGRGTVMVISLLGAVWLIFAVGINWLGMDQSVFLAFSGNTERILHGQVYRLLTAPPWLAIDGETGVVTGVPAALGDFAVSIEAAAANGETARQDYTLHVISL